MVIGVAAKNMCSIQSPVCPGSNLPHHHWEETGKLEEGRSHLFCDSRGSSRSNRGSGSNGKSNNSGGSSHGRSEGGLPGPCPGSQVPQQPQQHSSRGLWGLCVPCAPSSSGRVALKGPGFEYLGPLCALPLFQDLCYQFPVFNSLCLKTLELFLFPSYTNAPLLK